MNEFLISRALVKIGMEFLLLSQIKIAIDVVYKMKGLMNRIWALGLSEFQQTDPCNKLSHFLLNCQLTRPNIFCV